MKINDKHLVARMIILAGIACDERQKHTPTDSPKYEAFQKECDFYNELSELIFSEEWDEIERKLNERP